VKVYYHRKENVESTPVGELVETRRGKKKKSLPGFAASAGI
jgi:hypothetical protein